MATLDLSMSRDEIAAIQASKQKNDPQLDQLFTPVGHSMVYQIAQRLHLSINHRILNYRLSVTNEVSGVTPQVTLPSSRFTNTAKHSHRNPNWKPKKQDTATGSINCSAIKSKRLRPHSLTAQKDPHYQSQIDSIKSPPPPPPPPQHSHPPSAHPPHPGSQRTHPSPSCAPSKSSGCICRSSSCP